MAITAAFVVGGCLTAEPGEGDDSGGGGKADGWDSPVSLIQTNSPFYWAPSDYPTFVTSYSSLGGRALNGAIADTDALAMRLQGWVDRIDAIVRAEVKRNGGGDLVAPKPIVKVLESGSTYNAWVSPAVACLGANAAGAPMGTMEETLLETKESYHGSGFSCVRPTYPDMGEFKTFWGRHKPACTVADDMSIQGEGCAITTYTNPGELTFLSTSPYVHVTTDLIASVSERTLVVVLAHELGHYYRAHVTDATVQHYDFWYETEADRKKVPVESTVAMELQAAYAEISAGPQNVQPATTGIYSSRLRHWILGDLVPLLRERTEASFVCAAARDSLGPWVDALLVNYGMATDTMTSYLAFEKALAACAPALKMGGDPSATSLSFGTLLMTVPNAKLPPVTFPFYASLQDVLNAMNDKAVHIDEKAASLLRRVSENRIGLYTVEQEADNIALALSTKLGISGDDVVASWLEFITAIVSVVPPEKRAQKQAELDTCKAQLAAGFTMTDASGANVPVFVPIGDLTEPHHSDCYRLFNFWREQKIRKYEVETPLAFDASWDALREQARVLADAARMNGR